MSITRCPECTTTFKVTPEQMKMAQGWVRCGRCNAVFEALRHSQPSSIDARQQGARAEPAVTPTPSSVTDTPLTGDAALGSHADAIDPVETPNAPDDAAVFLKAGAVSPRRGRRALLVTANVLLVLLLLWQVLLYRRDALAAQAPALQPLLTALCAPVGCRIGWPHAPEALLIDSSSFTHDPQGFYNLQLRVKNTALHPVATPVLELMLLDVREDVVLRRVFSIEELGFDDHVEASGEVQTTLDFVLDATVAERVIGYRALLFYP